MCGIIGITGIEPATPRLVAGLQRLEYRGYDSAGIAVFSDDRLERRRAPGKIVNLEQTLREHPLEGLAGIAHTRWATHGKPTLENAHPHRFDRVYVVHNGIIENHAELKEKLVAKGRTFESETDTEVIAHVFNDYLDQGHAPRDAFYKTLGDLEGAYAIVAMTADQSDVLYCARLGSPMVLGHGQGENYVGSDTLALVPLTSELTYLEEGDWAELTPDAVTIFDDAGQEVARPKTISKMEFSEVSKGEHDHFMFKEILEQPDALARSIAPYIDADTLTLIPDPVVEALFADADRGVSVACGSAHYAAVTAQYWFEQAAKFHMTNEIASEFRYRDPVLPNSGPVLFVSQSGETADTLQAVKYSNANKAPTLAIVNVEESSIAREATQVHYTAAGPEIGVASTKAFTAQLVVLAITAFHAAKARGTLTPEQETDMVKALISLPDVVRQTLLLTDDVRAVGEVLAQHSAAIFVGRGQFAPIAFEGALKLKEIAYIYASAYAAGELKHGPIALIEPGFPVIAVAPMDALFHKTLSNLEESKSRGARIILITDTDGQKEARGIADDFLIIPKTSAYLSPILATIPLQLLAYYTALGKGTDVDMPRNLAKSVTVE